MKTSINKKSKVNPSTTNPITPTISIIKPTIPKTIKNDIIKYGNNVIVLLTNSIETKKLLINKPSYTVFGI